MLVILLFGVLFASLGSACTFGILAFTPWGGRAVESLCGIHLAREKAARLAKIAEDERG